MLLRESDSESAMHLVQEALGRIMLSQPFKTSRQCQDLLAYIVNHSLAGEEALLRERIIGIEVFGRKPDYDTADDPVVRIRASDVRKRLAVYYQTSHAELEPVRIDIPSGSYRATFEWTDQHNALPEAQDTRVEVGELPITGHPPGASAAEEAARVLPPRRFGLPKWLFASVAL